MWVQREEGGERGQEKPLRKALFLHCEGNEWCVLCHVARPFSATFCVDNVVWHSPLKGRGEGQK